MMPPEKRAHYNALAMEILDRSLKSDAAAAIRKSTVEVEAVDLIEFLDMMDMLETEVNMRKARRL